MLINLNFFFKFQTAKTILITAGNLGNSVALK